jgi:MFS family permease
MTAFLRREIAATARVLRGFTGNARAILVTEPAWAIPYNLVATYASVYMLELGCTPAQVGLVSTVGMALQLVFSLVSGWVTDRLGRRRTTLVFDLLSWSGATLLWAFARGFPWFLAAVAVNSLVRIVQTSWTCLAVEDAPVEQRVHYYTWISVAGVLAGFVAPLAGVLVGRFGLVPALRGLYGFAFVAMTTMFLVRNTMLVETRRGVERLRESRTEHPRHELRAHLAASREALRTPPFALAAAASVLVSIAGIVRSTFQSILLTRGLGFPAAAIALFPLLSSVVMLASLVFLVPALARRGTAASLAVGFGATAAGAALLAAAPGGNWPVALLATALGGVGSAVAIPVTDGFLANAVPDRDRARVMAVFYVVMFALSSPFGWIGGLLSGISPRLPLALVAGACAIGVAISPLARDGSGRENRRRR